MKRYLFFGLVCLIVMSVFVSAEGNQTDLKLGGEKIVVPDWAEKGFRVVFGLSNNEPVTLSNFVIMGALWLILFLIIWNISGMIPLLSRNKTGWLIALVITLLSSVSGGLNQALIAVYDFSLIERFGKYAGAISVTIALVVAIIIMSITRILKEKMGRETMLQTARDLKTGSRYQKVLGEFVNTLAGKN